MSHGKSTGLAARLNTADGLFSVDHSRRITFWNTEATRILGLKAGDVIGKTCYEVLCQPGSPGRDSCNRECQVFVNARRGRPTRDFDLSCTASDGTRRWLNVSVMFETPLQDGSELLHLFRDVTDSRSVERAVVANDAPDHQSGPEDAVHGVRAGLPLSRREDQVLQLLAAGKGTSEIAEALSVKPVSARNHITRLMNKLGASTRLQAVSIGMQTGLI